MITSRQIKHSVNARTQQEMPFGLGNTLFMIAGVIGIAMKNGYSFGFEGWPNQEFFVNPLPKVDNTRFIPYRIPSNYKSFDIGFCGFNIPDGCSIVGYLGSEKYFAHCKDLIRHYFTMKDLINPYKDCIIVHHRNYVQPEFAKLEKEFYLKALEYFPKKDVVVVTNDVKEAQKSTGLVCEYVNSSPIQDFYILTKAEYLIICNSSFSWWGAWLSGAKVVAPLIWYAGDFKDCPTKDLYPDNWTLV